jgi:hypothetical protein
MTLSDLVAFLDSQRLTLRSCQFASHEAVGAFTCDPLPEPSSSTGAVPEPLEEPDALERFISRDSTRSEQ